MQAWHCIAECFPHINTPCMKKTSLSRWKVQCWFVHARVCWFDFNEGSIWGHAAFQKQSTIFCCVVCRITLPPSLYTLNDERWGNRMHRTATYYRWWIPTLEDLHTKVFLLIENQYCGEKGSNSSFGLVSCSSACGEFLKQWSIPKWWCSFKSAVLLSILSSQALNSPACKSLAREWLRMAYEYVMPCVCLCTCDPFLNTSFRPFWQRRQPCFSCESRKLKLGLFWTFSFWLVKAQLASCIRREQLPIGF